MSKLTVLLTSFFVYTISNSHFYNSIGSINDSSGNRIHQGLTFFQGLLNKDFIRDFLYFDIVTYTTIGYGDFHPDGWLKLFAGLEGLVGVLLTSLLLVTAAKKVLW